MPTFSDKSEATKDQQASNEVYGQADSPLPLFQFADGRAETAGQQSMQEMISSSPLTAQLSAAQQVMQRNEVGQQSEEASQSLTATNEANISVIDLLEMINYFHAKRALEAEMLWQSYRRVSARLGGAKGLTKLRMLPYMMRLLKAEFEVTHGIKLKGNPLGGSWLANYVDLKDKVHPASEIYGDKKTPGTVHRKMIEAFYDHGAHAFITPWAYDRIMGVVKDDRFKGWGLDANFIGLKSEAEDQIKKHADWKKGGRGLFGLEKAYGIPPLDWVSACKPIGFKIWRFTVEGREKLEKLDARLPSGNEKQAFGSWWKGLAFIRGQWKPGGSTEGGLREAVLDPTFREDTAQGGKPRIEDYVKIELSDKLVEATLKTIERENRDPETFKIREEADAAKESPPETMQQATFPAETIQLAGEGGQQTASAAAQAAPEVDFLKPGIESRQVKEKTQIRYFEGGKMKTHLLGHTYTAGELVNIDNSDIKAESEDDIGRNNLFVKIAGTENKYIRLARLSMYLPSSGLESSVPEGEVDTASAKEIEQMLKVEHREFTEKGKTVKADLTEIDYRDRKEKGLLSDTEMRAIRKLSETKKGTAFLREMGFLNEEEMDRWARDRQVTGFWERYEEHKFTLTKHGSKQPFPGPGVSGNPFLSHIHRIQIATRQKELALSSDAFKKTPGYMRYLASLLESPRPNDLTASGFKSVEKVKAHIYDLDTAEWEKTLDFDPEKLSKVSDPRARQLDTVAQASGALGVLRRVLLILHDGLQYRDDQKEKLEKDWKENVAVALSHGGRVEIVLPPSKGAYEHSFMDWLLGGVEQDRYGTQSKSKKEAGIDRRAFSSHNVTRDKHGQVTEHKQNTLGLKGSHLHWAHLGILAVDANAEHLGMDLPIGGLGNIDLAGETILPDGRHGHMYIYYKPPSTEKPGAVLIGIETSRMKRTDVMGQHHDKRGAPAEFSSVGTSKKGRIGDEFGGRVVDYTKEGRPADWMIKLKKAEMRINEGLLKSKEEVIRRLIGKPDKTLFEDPEQRKA